MVQLICVFFRSTVFVFALEVVVFIVAFIFMTLTPPPTVRPEAKKRYNVEDESTPLISVARRDDDDDNDERRSPSIGYNSQVNNVAGVKRVLIRVKDILWAVKMR